MKLSKSDLAKVQSAAQSVKRATKLVSLPNEVWEQLKAIGMPVPNNNFTISGFLYGERFNFKRFVANHTKKNLIKLTAYCLQRLDIAIEVEEKSGMYLFLPARLRTIDDIYNRMRADRLEPLEKIVYDENVDNPDNLPV